MTKHYENLKFMAHLRVDGFVSRRLLRKLASMGMFWQHIRRYWNLFTKGPILRIGTYGLSSQTRSLYSTVDLANSAKLLLAAVTEMMYEEKPLAYDKICDILKNFHRHVTIYRLRTVRYLAGWRLVRFALFCDNQCIIVENGERGYEVIGYYIKASKFTSFDCIPEKFLPEYRQFSNFL